MKNKKSIAAVDAAIAFGEGKISKQKLKDAAAAAEAEPAAAEPATDPDAERYD